MLYIILEVILLCLIFILVRVILKKEISKFLSYTLKVLCVLWIILSVVEVYKHNQIGLSWEVSNFELIGIYTYTKLVFFILLGVSFFVKEKNK